MVVGKPHKKQLQKRGAPLMRMRAMPKQRESCAQAVGNSRHPLLEAKAGGTGAQCGLVVMGAIVRVSQLL